MIIPHRELSADALTGLIEEFVTRDGTDHTDVGAKMANVRRGLDRGELLVVYDSETGSCNLVSTDDLPPD